MQKYKRIIIEGFGSCCKPVVFPLDRVGINLIKGTNGKGKSTIFDALIWAEYGISSRETVESWPEVRTESFRGTRVVVERTDGEYDYRIARHIKFNGTTQGLKGSDTLMIFQKPINEPKFTKDHLVGDKRNKGDMKSLIIDQLGADHKAFTNSVIMPQSAAGLIQMQPKDQRAMFDKLFTLSWIEDAKTKGKEQRDLVVEELNELGEEQRLATSKIQSLEEFITQQEANEAQFEAAKAKRVQAQQKELDEETKAQDKLEKEKLLLESWLKSNPKPEQETEYTSNKEAYDRAEKKHVEAENKKIEAYNYIQNCAKEIESSKLKEANLEKQLSEVKEKCPYCEKALLKSKVKGVKDAIKKDIAAEHSVQKEVIKKQEEGKKVYDAAVLVCEEQAEILKEVREIYLKEQKAIQEFEQIKTEYENKERQLNFKIQRFVDAKTRVAKAKVKLNSIESEEIQKVDLTEKKAQLEKLKLSVKTAVESCEKLTSRKEDIDWWLKKGLGSSGVRAFVFNAMLNSLNQHAEKYAKRLGYGVLFSVDLTKASTPFTTTIYFGDKAKSYKDFSGGQKRRVGLCLWFAMNDLISEKCGTNLFVMDEGFEGLDNEGVEAAFDLLRVKAQDRTVFVITHSDIIDNLNCKSIYIGQDANGSTTVQC